MTNVSSFLRRGEGKSRPDVSRDAHLSTATRNCTSKGRFKDIPSLAGCSIALIKKENSMRRLSIKTKLFSIIKISDIKNSKIIANYFLRYFLLQKKKIHIPIAKTAIEERLEIIFKAFRIIIPFSSTFIELSFSFDSRVENFIQPNSERVGERVVATGRTKGVKGED